jgi:hypothetical protein
MIAVDAIGAGVISWALVKGALADELTASVGYPQSTRPGTWQSGMIQSLTGSFGSTRVEPIGNSGALPGSRVKVFEYSDGIALDRRRRRPPCLTQIVPTGIDGSGIAWEPGQTKLHRSCELRM